MSDGLVVDPVDTTNPFTGTGVLESLVGTGQALAAGDWVDAAVFGVATGLETLSAVMDPLGALFSAGIGFLLEHLEPFPTWLDQLTGDAGQVAAFAATWRNIAEHVRQTGDDFLDAVASASGSWDGVAVAAYRAAAKAQAAVVDGFAVMVDGVAAATDLAGAIVAGVRELVRDAIADVVGFAISNAAQALTVVLAPKAVAAVTAKVSEWVAKIQGFIKGLITSMGTLGKHLDEIVEVAGDAGASIKRLAAKWATTDVGTGSYDWSRVLRGTATAGDGLPTLANITYQVGSGAAKHATSLDNEP